MSPVLDKAFCQGAPSGPQHGKVGPKQSSAVVGEAAGNCRAGYRRGKSCEGVRRGLISSILGSTKELHELEDISTDIIQPLG